ncbi:MAG: heavy-metal-associated domain-containing protein [Bacteroidaceae bacterium]
MQKKVFSVSGLKCMHCQNAVQEAVSQLKGVTSAEVSLAQGTLMVEYDEACVSPCDIRAAVEGSGNFRMAMEA